MRLHSRKRAVATGTIGGNEQSVAVGIVRTSHRLPPAPDRIHSEAGGVVIDANADPAGVACNVVDSAWHGVTKFGDLKVMHTHCFGLPLGRCSWPAFLKSPTSSFFWVSTEIHWLARGKSGLHRCIDLVELRISIGRVTAF